MEQGEQGRRRWVIGDKPDADGFIRPVDRETSVEALVAIETMGHFLGGTFTITPLRRPVIARADSDLAAYVGEPIAGAGYITTGWYVQWASFSPALEPRAALTAEPDGPPDLQAEIAEREPELGLDGDEAAPEAVEAPATA